MNVLKDAMTDEAMSEDQRALYGNGGAAGLVLLARDLQSKGVLAGGKKKPQQRTNPLANRHHAEGGGPQPVAQDELSEEAKIRKLMATPGSEILKMLEEAGLE